MTHFSALFVRRPVATTLISVAVLLAGVLAYVLLPVASLPQTEFPTITVQASLPGASPAVVASSIATPLERQFGRIAGVTEMTSASSQGTTTITLQFDLGRNLNGAARDVQAAINAARSQLPANLPAAPFYRKVNPAEPSILILVIESETVPLRELYDIADSQVGQKIAQVEGVGQVSLNGSSKPAVRVEVNPLALNAYGMGFERLRGLLESVNVNKPKGHLRDATQQWEISATDQLTRAAEYSSLIAGSSHGAIVRVGDVARVEDSVEDTRSSGFINGHHAIQIIVSKAPGANVIATVDRIFALLPQLNASISPAIRLYSMMDRTTTIRASIRDISWSVVLSIVLVVLVVFAFLREWRSTFIPSVSVPLSLLGTLFVMYVLGYTLDNLSLMAITVATGFVVDDAIVVIENVDRYLHMGMTPREAALRGASEISFTVLAMSVTLVAAFLPMLLMGGIVGRLFREFAIVLSIAVGLSLLVSLSVTPMLCALLLEHRPMGQRGWFYATGERALDWIEGRYASGVRRVLRHQGMVLCGTVLVCGLTVSLYLLIPKGFFPLQDTGRIFGQLRAAQDVSFDQLSAKSKAISDIIVKDPALGNLSSFFGTNSAGPSPNAASLFLVLKSYEQRHGLASSVVIERLRREFAKVPGVTITLQQQQELNIGARTSAAQFQYTLSSDRLELLNEWAPKMASGLRKLPALRDVVSDQLNGGLTAQVVVDRDTAARFGVSSQQVDETLYDAFGQRQVSTIYGATNQYHVVMEAAPGFGSELKTLESVYVRGAGKALVPLAAFSHIETHKNPLVVNHQGQFAAVTISFNLSPGYSLGDATDAVEKLAQTMGMPSAVHAGFAGSAQVFQSSLKSQPWLILLSLVTIYIVLGILYESLIHPLTILSTLPSAGVGALLALMLFKNDLSVTVMIGLVLLMGIVQKNSIMLIDSALMLERTENRPPREAIYEACRRRFRPILMTTVTALLGALPLALGKGIGFELRRPLGISIVGGLLSSLFLTLFTVPVLYLYLSRVGRFFSARKAPAVLAEARYGL